MRARLLLAGILGAMALAGPLPAARAAPLPPIGHVFVVVLENGDPGTAFASDSPAPYLAHDLPAMGQFLPNYYGIGHMSLDNYVALISGQGPNPDTQSDCQTYSNFAAGTMIGAQGQASGSGCVYPASVQTIADQLTARGLTWKGYMEDMGNSPPASATCRHPPPGENDSGSGTPGDGYVTHHNPFVYFHSIIDSPACAANDVPLSALAGDLGSVATTPNFSLITPNLCHDGHDSPCADGEPGGLTSAGRFLSGLVPQILASPAFRQDGLLAVIFDEAGGSAACCGEQAANTSSAGGDRTPGPGGGRAGAVLVSPYIPAGSVNSTAYNHYGLLRSVEDLFGLSHLGYAGADGLSAFGDDVFHPPLPSHPSSPGTPPGSAPGSAAPCPRALFALPRGNLPRGTLIASARRSGRRRHLVLRLTFTRGARLNVSVPVGRRIRRLASRTVHACLVYRLALPAAAHGTLTLTASVSKARERRALRL